MLKRILTAYIVASICLFFALGYIVANKSADSIKEELINTASISMDESYRSISNIIESVKDTSLNIAANNSVQNYLNKYLKTNNKKYLDELDNYLDEFPGVLSIYSDISIHVNVDDDNRYENIKQIDSEEIYKALNNPSDFIWIKTTDNNKDTLRQLKAIYSNTDYKSIIGIISIDIDVDSIRSIAEVANSTGNRFYLIGENGEIFYPHYNYDHIPEEFLTSIEDGNHEIDDNLLIARKLKTTKWKLIKVISISKINSKANDIEKSIIYLAIAFAGMSLVVAIIFITEFLRPVTKLSKKMNKVKTGELEVLDKNVKGEIGDLYDSYNFMIDRINKEIESNYKSKIREKDAELKALQAQINPHFLYNTLNSINWLALKYKAKDISKMVLALSDMFRLSLNKGKNILTVKEELKQVDSYIILQKVRYSDSFEVEYNVDDSVLERNVLKMLLQPIVENAIIHGFKNLDKDCKIIITVKDNKTGTYFEVKNNGNLLDLNKINKLLNDDIGNEAGGYGINNVNERIKALYGEEYGLSYKIDCGWSVASFIIPLEKNNESSNS